MRPFLSRTALRRVVGSLLRSELQASRGGLLSPSQKTAQAPAWDDDLDLGESSSAAAGCDSLELLNLSAAVNEMFHLYEAGSASRLLADTTLGAWLTLIEEAWQRGVDRITLSTSGSTGVPKRCTHRFQDLRVEVEYLADLFRGRSRVVALAPAKHIYGLLFTALLPDRLGVPVLEFDTYRDRPNVSAGPHFEAGDLIVSVPEMWTWLERSVPAWQPGIEGVVSTAPCAEATLASLVRKGLARVFEVYGSTETAGIGVRTWPERAYTLMPHWSTKTGPDASPVLLRTGADEVVAMDKLAFLSDRHFLVGGRRDQAVQVGGTNVFPARVERVLLTQPGVSAVAVRLMRLEEGTRLKTFIVPDARVCPTQLRESLERAIPMVLQPAERPKHIMFGHRLPCDAQGKLCDW